MKSQQIFQISTYSMATVCKAGGTKNAGRSNNIRTRAGKGENSGTTGTPPSLPPQLTRTKATWMSVMDLANLDIRFYLKLFYYFTIGSHRKVEKKTCKILNLKPKQASYDLIL